VRLTDTSISTKRVISPEGRYLVKRDNTLEPVTMLGFSRLQKDRPIAEVETELRIRDEFRVLPRIEDFRLRPRVP